LSLDKVTVDVMRVLEELGLRVDVAEVLSWASASLAPKEQLEQTSRGK